MQFSPRLFTRERPVDGGAVVVDAAVPGMDFAAQCSEVPDSAVSRTLSAEQAHFDSGLVKPTEMPGGVVCGDAVPQQAPPTFRDICRESSSATFNTCPCFCFAAR